MRRPDRHIPAGFPIVMALLVVVAAAPVPTITAGLSSEPPKQPETGPCALTHVTIVVGRDGRVLPDHSLLIRGNRIETVAPSGQLAFPDGCRVLDLAGKFVIPGLIDAHNHVSGRSEKALSLALRHGITGIRDMGGDCAYLAGLSEAIRQGEVTGPDLRYSALVAGEDFIIHDKRAMLSTPGNYELGRAPGMRSVSGSSDLDEIISESVRIGATGMKIYSHLRPETVRRITDLAHRAGLKAWAHGVVPPTTLEEVVGAGVDCISHVGFFLVPTNWDLKKHGSLAFDRSQVAPERLEDVFTRMKEAGTMLDATLTLTRRMAQARIDDPGPRGEYLNACLLVIREAHRQGVEIVAGTDIFLPSRDGTIPELHEEIRLLAEDAGLGACAAIQSATFHGAKVLGIEEDYGTIEQGKIADLVVLNSDPLENIRNTEDIHLVIKNGMIIHGRETE